MFEMSWSTLKKTFLAEKHTLKVFKNKSSKFKRKRVVHFENVRISDDSDSDERIRTLPSCSSKKLKLNISIEKSGTHLCDSADEGRIDFDPDTSPTCNGCSSQKVPIRPLEVSYRSSAHYIANKKSHISAQRPENQASSKLELHHSDMEYGTDDIQVCEERQPLTPVNSPNSPLKKTISVKNTTNKATWSYLRNSIMLPKEDISIDESEEDAPILATREQVDGDTRHTGISSKYLRRLNPEAKAKQYIKKGGYLKNLKTALSKYQSNRAFWQHERSIGIAEIGLRAEVKSKQVFYGTTVICCCCSGNQDKYICVRDPKLLRILEVGAKIEAVFETNSCFRVEGKEFYSAVNKIVELKS